MTPSATSRIDLRRSMAVFWIQRKASGSVSPRSFCSTPLAAPSAVEARLREVSPDALSPREALDLVYALVAELPPEG